MDTARFCILKFAADKNASGLVERQLTPQPD